ncbi:MAG: hypothetical protein QM626_13610 [Microbacterium sp.]|uniref:hypothetical protein n=1 Tax=Microbacterium sp. TaxID=51671 RepID=UPI0039E69472
MTRYLVLYRLPLDAPDPMNNPDPASEAEGKAAWGTWIRDAGRAVVDIGAPTFPLDRPAEPDRVSGFSILETASPAELEWLLATHPHRKAGTFEVHAFAAPAADAV